MCVFRMVLGPALVGGVSSELRVMQARRRNGQKREPVKRTRLVEPSCMSGSAPCGRPRGCASPTKPRMASTLHTGNNQALRCPCLRCCLLAAEKPLHMRLFRGRNCKAHQPSWSSSASPPAAPPGQPACDTPACRQGAHTPRLTGADAPATMRHSGRRVRTAAMPQQPSACSTPCAWLWFEEPHGLGVPLYHRRKRGFRVQG